MELDNLLKNVKDIFDKLNIIDKKTETQIILGLSGGPDSILLYYILKKISHELKLNIFPVYINHLIRDRSTDESEKLSKYLRERFKERLYVISVNVPKLAKEKKYSVEEAGRYVRYLLLKKIAELKKAHYIALGHNLDDNVETIIFRLCRGTGIEGLKAMNIIQGNIIRPLLDVRKQDIVSMVKKLNLFFIEDESNLSLEYTRNRIRHKILGELIKLNEKALEHIHNLSKDARDLSNYLEEYVNNLIQQNLIYKDSEIVICKIPENAKDYLIKEYLKGLYKLFNGNTQKIKREQIEKFLELSKKTASFSINFPNDIVFEKGFDYLLIRKKGYNLSFKPHKIEGKKVLVNEKIGTLEFDKELEEDIIIRPFEDGDIYRGEKLKIVFQHKKIPKFLRKVLPLLAVGKHILYIPLFDSNSFIISLKDKKYKLNFKEGPLYSKINQIFKTQEKV